MAEEVPTGSAAARQLFVPVQGWGGTRVAVPWLGALWRKRSPSEEDESLPSSRGRRVHRKHAAKAAPAAPKNQALKKL